MVEVAVAAVVTVAAAPAVAATAVVMVAGSGGGGGGDSGDCQAVNDHGGDGDDGGNSGDNSGDGGCSGGDMQDAHAKESRVAGAHLIKRVRRCGQLAKARQQLLRPLPLLFNKESRHGAGERVGILTVKK
jgi:hypothetical protein